VVTHSTSRAASRSRPGPGRQAARTSAATRRGLPAAGRAGGAPIGVGAMRGITSALDRKSTRLNSSHVSSLYAVFCSKKKTWVGWVRPERSDAPGGGAHAEGKRGASLLGAASAAVARSQGSQRRPLLGTHLSGVCLAL